ncbi:hypothetical protein Ngar_c08070 [Candidatus Nitrososphaera gargensis Ga9.2]|uniref:Uncharacterized protein n=1 Tax=Nitrososphaera gargensis (strain Ga9.2) TaxID=1237085 RepID=K0IMC0_NITGG|nr:hypothetical protein [Candidatus Nitrososphaera gargensis]AFU57749.1 hypothetical protein Ngar_c08070 [Candidatus Nitrososphaera gargensis Ga9.2]
MALENDIRLDMNFATSIVEAGAATYPIGYVRLVSNDTSEPVIAPSDLEIGLLSTDASIAFVPSRVTIPAGSDYAQFNVEVSDLAGKTEISAQYGDQKVTRTFKVVDALNLIEDIDLVINLASNKMQVASEMPFSVYLEDNGNILQAPEDIVVKLDYESSLVQLDSDSLVIKKGSYYATGTIKTLEKSGNAFIRAESKVGTIGHLNTVTNVEISQTQPASLKVYVFPDQVSLHQNTIDIFVGVLDAAGQPTLAAEDIKLELFSSAYQLAGIESAPAVIKKGEFGFYLRQYMRFYGDQEVTIGASASGLGSSTATFKVLEDSLGPTHPKALDRTLKVFTVDNMPSDSDSIAVYQLNAIERDDDDVDCNHNGDLTDDGDDCDNDGSFDTHRDSNKDGVINEKDWHPVDDLGDGALYPIDSISIYSPTQGNLNIVSGDNLAARVFDPGYISSGSSYGTATILSGRQANNVDISVSLSNFAVGSNTLTVVGGLNPVQTKIFSPGGYASDSSYRVLFDRNGFTDLFFITLDSSGRPSNSDKGVKYLVKPINELTEINPGSSFASMHISENSFKTGSAIVENTIKKISAVPVGVNSDSRLQTTSDMHLLFHTGTASQVLLPFDSIVAFSKAHPIGIIQLRDVSGNPVLAPDDVAVRLFASSLSNVLPVSVVTIPKGKSFASFDVATFGRADNFTIYATADGLQSSSVMLAPVVAELPASFIGTTTFTASVPAVITVSTPIPNVTISWGTSSGLSLGDKTTFKPAGNSYVATAQVISENPGTFTVDATLLKDGFKPTRITKEVMVGQYHRQMNAILVDNGAAILAYNQPVMMKVLVQDVNGAPVPGATVKVEDSGPHGLMFVSSVTTDASGTASFIYTPTNIDKSSNLITLMVTAYKDGYQTSRYSKIVEIDGSSTVLPPVPIIGNMFAGLPSWTSYAVLGGVAAVGSGIYMLKKQKNPEDEEPLIEEAGAAKETTEKAEAAEAIKETVVEEAIEEDKEDDETEEEET